MKKVIIIITAVLIFVYIAFSIVATRSEYGVERLLYKAVKKYEKVKVNPDVAPPKLIASVERDLEKLIKVYPDTKTIKGAYIVLAEAYTTDKKYNEAIRVLDDFISKHSDNIFLLTRAYFLKGQAYEKQDKWEKALEQFAILRDKYINTPLGLQMPLYIAEYYANKQKGRDAEKAFNDAAAFYDKLRQDNIGNMLGYSSSNLLVQVYMQTEKYEEAGRVVEDIINTYPTTMSYMQQLPLVESIYLKNLKKSKKVIEIYERVVNATQDVKLKEILQKKIKVLKGEKGAVNN